MSDPQLAGKKPPALRQFLIGGLLPVVAFAVIEEIYGTAAGLVAGMLFGGGEMIYEYVSQRKIQGITIVSNVLVIALGGLSLLENNGVFFKLQPAILTFAFAFFLMGSSLFKRPMLVELAKKQQGELAPHATALLARLNFRLSFCLIAIGLVGVYAAFYWSTAWWATYKAVGAPVMMMAYMAIEFAILRWRRKKTVPVGDMILLSFMRTSWLDAEMITKIRKALGGAQPFTLYFNAALEDWTKRGQDNRWFYVTPAADGLVLGIDFDEKRIFTVVGKISDGLLRQVLALNSHRLEFHVPFENAGQLKAAGQERLIAEHELRYYSLRRDKPFAGDFSRLRRLTPEDFTLVETFYRQHYDGTIFSRWMLEQPFWGLFDEGGALLASGGAIVIDSVGRAANIGNFLTATHARGQGLGKIVAKCLINDLIARGLTEFTLGTAKSNIAAWKTYEAVGFRMTEERSELEFSQRR